MQPNRRLLTVDDIAAVLRVTSAQSDTQKVYDLVQSISFETCGWVLLTTLKFVESDGVVERIHSSDQASHPVGGRKPLDKLTESHGGAGPNDIFHAPTKEDVRRAFYDHELIFDLGIGSILNVPTAMLVAASALLICVAPNACMASAKFKPPKFSRACWRQPCCWRLDVRLAIFSDSSFCLV